MNDAIDKILESKSVSCLIVAHRLSTIARAEKVAVLENGRIVEFGLYKGLAFKEDSKFRELMGAQLDAVRI